MVTISISPCQDKKTLALFEQVPELLHKDDPYFVPPFPGSIAKIFNSKSPYQAHGELLPFVAYRDGKPVGRIAAIVNRRHNEYYKDKIGFFGFFDSIDDTEVASALLRRAETELRQRNLDVLRGPYNPTVNDECGLLIEGFETPPFVMMPYNPPYYIGLYEKLGLQRARDLFAFYLSADFEAPDRIRKIVERVKKSTGLSLRSLDLKRLPEELKIIQALYNETLDRNWGFVPVSYEDLAFAAADLKAIIDPNMVMIAERNGVPAGFSMVIPNVNEFMLRVKRSGTLMRILKFVWYMKTSAPKEARLAVLGIRPEYRNSGIAALFYWETLMRGKRKYIGGELSWVEESNQEIIKGITVMGGKKYKSYRIFEKPLGT
jgi:hypothetical protein